MNSGELVGNKGEAQVQDEAQVPDPARWDPGLVQAWALMGWDPQEEQAPLGESNQPRPRNFPMLLEIMLRLS